ncbi:hypothetical protein P7F88_19425 [Vibrio hannami]|uniref:hypothetical protein n=1 Tax=Vibrio hannami TaxID=2717094 RepID=UPI0024106688|nr:hypothetical protein [Vibrio hannami]MDG3088128.1 hypothetical protein [Vibrio hannami]
MSESFMVAIYAASYTSESRGKIFVSTVDDGIIGEGLTILYVKNTLDAKEICDEVQDINGMEIGKLSQAIAEIEDRCRMVRLGG